MSRFAYFLVSLPLLVTLLSGVEAGPACAHRSQGTDDCIEACGDKWGWPGRLLGTDRWGPIVTKATGTDALAAAATKACHPKSSSTAGSAATAAANAQGSASVSSEGSVSMPVSSVAAGHFSFSRPAGFTHSRVWTRSPGCSRSHRRRPTSSPAQFTSAKPTTTNTPTNVLTTDTPSTVRTTSAPTIVRTTSTSHTTSTPHTPGTSHTTTTPHTTVAKTTSAAQPSSTSSSGSTSQSDIDAYLTAHNTVRAQHGASDLTWSDELASAAQSWANKCDFEHSGGSLGPYGENLAAGTGDSYDIAAAVKSWTDEDYDSSNPQPSHFTQVVWKGSKQLGCAVAECSGIFDPKFGIAKFYVCEYSPVGNVIGEFAQNVQA